MSDSQAKPEPVKASAAGTAASAEGGAQASAPAPAPAKAAVDANAPRSGDTAAKPAPSPGPKAPAAATAPAPASPPPPPPPNPLAHLPLPFAGVDYALRGFHADATVPPEQVVAAAEVMNQAGFSLDTITGVDWMAQGQMEVVYDFFHAHKPVRAVIRTRVPRENPELATISEVYPGANWHERETHDFFGIRFKGHPNLTPFLLPEDATYHPLRKDFSLS